MTMLQPASLVLGAQQERERIIAKLRERSRQMYDEYSRSSVRTGPRGSSGYLREAVALSEFADMLENGLI